MTADTKPPRAVAGPFGLMFGVLVVVSIGGGELTSSLWLGIVAMILGSLGWRRKADGAEMVDQAVPAIAIGLGALPWLMVLVSMVMLS